jgi:predicted phage terminase large subunit-like protein
MNIADLIEARAIEQARASFWSYRQYINPKLKKGWFHRVVSHELQIFWEDMKAGKRPKLVIQAPPQHGKSMIAVEWISWICGHDPWLKTIYASFSKRLGTRANKALQRIFDSEKYKKVFPQTRINEANTKVIQGKKQRTSEIIEYAGTEGSFRNTTVAGSITGESLDVGVIDDPIKGRQKANNETHRDTVWEWFIDDFFTRFSENACFLAILTRWHLDDPIGRFIKHFPETKVLSFPALAEPGFVLHALDPRVPGSGEALFPGHKSREFLLERKKVMITSSWLSLYMQSPIVIGGEIIKGEEFRRYRMLPAIKYRKIYADTAQKTKEHNDYSVFECWGHGEDGNIYLIDLLRGKWISSELKTRAVDFWNKHLAIQGLGALRQMVVEDKSSGTGLVQDIKVQDRIPVKGLERNKDKLTRVMDVVNYISSGRVHIPEEAPFVTDFIAECEAFTADMSHPHDDQIDPMCDAITDMLASKPVSFFDVQ